MKDEMQAMGMAARDAARAINRATTGQKNDALEAIAFEIASNRDKLMVENEKDLKFARLNDITDAMLDRLAFTGARFDSTSSAHRECSVRLHRPYLGFHTLR